MKWLPDSLLKEHYEALHAENDFDSWKLDFYLFRIILLRLKELQIAK